MKTRELVFVAAATAATGCMGAPPDEGQTATGDVSGVGATTNAEARAAALARFQERLLEDTVRGDVHVRMFEIAPGRVAVSQQGPIGVAPFFAQGEVESWDAELLYRKLHPEALTVPKTVTDVALHRQQLGPPRAIPEGEQGPPQEQDPPQEIATPPNPPPSDSGETLLYDFATDDAAWFTANFCAIGSRDPTSVANHGGPGGYDTWCWTNAGGVGWLKRPNQYDSHVTMMSASSTDTAEMKFYATWDCGWLWYSECDGTHHDDPVYPRQWLSWSTNTGFYSWGNGSWYHHGGYYGSRSKAGGFGD